MEQPELVMKFLTVLGTPLISGVTELKFIMPINSLRIFWC